MRLSQSLPERSVGNGGSHQRLQRLNDLSVIARHIRVGEAEVPRRNHRVIHFCR